MSSVLAKLFRIEQRALSIGLGSSDPPSARYVSHSFIDSRNRCSGVSLHHSSHSSAAGPSEPNSLGTIISDLPPAPAIHGPRNYSLVLASNGQQRFAPLMACLALILIVLFPRLVLALLFLFTSYLNRPYSGNFLTLLLGFIFLPLTTLLYAWMVNNHVALEGLNLAFLLLAAILDLGLVRGSYRRHRGRLD